MNKISQQKLDQPFLIRSPIKEALLPLNGGSIETKITIRLSNSLTKSRIQEYEEIKIY